MLGKIFAGVVMLTGVGVIAVPTGLIGSSLSEEFARRALADHPDRCPTCGRAREGGPGAAP